MHVARIALDPGDIIAAGRGSFLLVLKRQENGILHVVKVLHEPAAAHRADLVPGWQHMAFSGLPYPNPTIRCVRLLRRLPENGSGVVKVGKTAPSVLVAVTALAHAEDATRRFEESPRIASNMTASTASSGRQVGAHRYG